MLHLHLRFHRFPIGGCGAHLCLNVLNKAFCCSKNKRVAIVWGPKRTKLGSHPRSTHRNPSRLLVSTALGIIERRPGSLITLVLMTSNGLQTVVATRLASRRSSELCRRYVLESELPGKQALETIVGSQLARRHSGGTEAIRPESAEVATDAFFFAYSI